MLKQLQINNYALLDEISISFEEALTVITGETGAGKSIMLGALGLVLGERADMSVLRDKKKKCIVEALFRIGDYSLEGVFKENELDHAEETTIRREITPEGKSRAFINDTPVNLAVLKELSRYLIDIHSQHETLSLNQVSFRFDMIDALAVCLDARKQYLSLYQQLKEKEKKLAELLSFEQQAQKDLDYYSFQFNELEQVKLEDGQIMKLEQAYDSLNNAEFIKQLLMNASERLGGGEDSILPGLASVKSLLNQLARFGKEYEELNARLNSVYIELKDLASETDRAADHIQFDKNKLEEITRQLDLLNRLLKKHNAKDEGALLVIKDEIEQKLDRFNSVEEEIKKLRKDIEKSGLEVLAKARLLSEKRIKAIPSVEQSVQKMLESLGMPNARLQLSCERQDTCNEYGCDELQFLFSANKGSPLSELHKVASGGELSRLMLCLKSQMARQTHLPTIIFDEIDTGISGDVAYKTGNILSQMGQRMQVIAITHLPQIASQGDDHLFVYKKDVKGVTQSEIKKLSGEGRIEEIAKMLSAGKPTQAALSNARELLKTAN